MGPTTITSATSSRNSCNLCKLSKLSFVLRVFFQCAKWYSDYVCYEYFLIVFFIFFLGFFQNWLVLSLCVCVYIFYLSLTWIFISRQTKFVCCTVLYVKSHTTRIHNSSCSRTQTHTRTNAHIYIRTLAHRHMHTFTHSYTHTHAHDDFGSCTVSVFSFHIETKYTR